MDAWWLAIGVGVGGLIGVLATLWLTRRLWRSARRLSVRTRGVEQLAELGQLAGGLAHEIKNPLSTIHINLKLLAEDLNRYRDETHARWLRRLLSVQEEADRLKGILDDFLRFAGKVEMNPAVVDLRVLMGELSDFFMPQAEAARVVMRTTLPETPVTCRVDVNLFKQAILNLMLNAVQAMEQGGELLIRLGASRSRAVIEVIDTGPGIPPADLPKVFHVYYSTKARGSGFGLPTTRRIVQEHGGDIRVDSAVGKGTRFTISLPLVKG